MSITSTSKIFTVGDSEYGYATTSFYPVSSGNKVSLYVPKVMGAITSVGPENIIPNGLLANAPDCPITYSTTVTKSKALHATVKENCNWLDKLTSGGVIPANSQFTVEFLNGNISSPYITTK